MELLVERIAGAASAHHFTASAAWREQHLALTPEPAGDVGAGDASHAGADDALPRVDALEVALEATRHGDDLLLEGRVRAETALLCSRCLARFPKPLDEPFRLLLEPAGERVPADPEATRALAADGLCLDDTFATGWYRGPALHLDRFVAESVLLALPLQPLCRESCLGLCPGCGADRNHAGRCACPEATPHSPFAKLAPLRASLQRKPSRETETETGGPR